MQNPGERGTRRIGFHSHQSLTDFRTAGQASSGTRRHSLFTPTSLPKAAQNARLTFAPIFLKRVLRGQTIDFDFDFVIPPPREQTLNVLVHCYFASA